MSRAVMQQALEALECPGKAKTDDEQAAIAALEQALAEPEQEPVRLQCTTCGTVYADGVPPQVPEQRGWFTVEELNEFAIKLKEKAWK